MQVMDKSFRGLLMLEHLLNKLNVHQVPEFKITEIKTLFTESPTL